MHPSIICIIYGGRNWVNTLYTWTACQSVEGYRHTQTNKTISPIDLTVCLWIVGGNLSARKEKPGDVVNHSLSCFNHALFCAGSYCWVSRDSLRPAHPMQDADSATLRSLVQENCKKQKYWTHFYTWLTSATGCGSECDLEWGCICTKCHVKLVSSSTLERNVVAPLYRFMCIG